MGRARVVAGVGIGCAVLLLMAAAVAVLLVWAVERRDAGAPHAGAMGLPASPVPLPTPNPDLASQPQDPWSQEATTPRAVLLFAPLLIDGVMTPEGRQAALYLAEPWNIALPDDIALADTRRVAGNLEGTGPYAPRHHRVTPEGIAAIVRFYSATHWVEGTLEQGEAEWVARLTLHTPAGTHEKSFAVPPQGDFVLAAQAGPWLAEHLGLELAEDFRRHLAAMPYGADITGVHDAGYQALVTDTDHPGWAALTEGPDATPDARLQRIRMMIQNRADLARLREATPGPLPADAELWQRKARWFALEHLGDRPTGRHEVLSVVARNPGHGIEAARLLFAAFGRGEQAHAYIDTARRWHQRAAPSPVHDAWLANVYTKAAWSVRGGGYAYTVGSSAMTLFEEWNREAITLYRGAIEAAGPIPWVAEDLCGALGATGDHVGMMEVHRQAIAAWPDHDGTWRWVLWYTLPRWGGSIDQVGDLLEEAMDHRPQNPRIGGLPWHIYSREAEAQQGRFSGVLHDLMQRHPRMREHLQRGIVMQTAGHAGPRDVAMAIPAIMVLGEGKDAQMRELVRRHPTVHRDIYAAVGAAWSGSATFEVAIAHGNLGNWRLLDEIVLRAARDDPRYTGTRSEGRVVFRTPKWDNVIRAYAAIFNGREAEGLHLLDQILQPDFDLLVNITFLRLITGRLDDGVRAQTEEIARQRAGESDFLYLAALAALRAGDAAAARDWATRADAAFKPDQSEAFRREVRRLVLGIDEPRPEDAAAVPPPPGDPEPAEEDLGTQPEDAVEFLRMPSGEPQMELTP